MLSLGTCDSCIVMDDGLNILPISSNTANISPVEKTNTTEDPQLKSLKESLQDTQPVGVLVNCCKTVDQVITRIFYLIINCEKLKAMLFESEYIF